MARSADPYTAFRFGVELGAIEIGGFSQIAGLARETVFEEYREGGVNDFHHKLVTGTKYPNLTLRRGLVDGLVLWAWHEAVIAGEVVRAPISVVLREADGSEAVRWVFFDAFPVKWSASDLDGGASAVVVEAIEFVHHGMKRI